MLDPNLIAQLQSYLKNIVRPVEITAFTDDRAESQQLLDLLAELKSASPMIQVETRRDETERTPSFTLNSPGQDIHLQFAGIPMGHEFTSLILALLHVGGHPAKEPPSLLEQVCQLKGKYRFETYFSLSCQNCPDVVQALNLMAVLNPDIEHTAIDGALFPQEIDARQIMAVPTVYLNGALFSQGRMTLEEIVNKLDTRSEEQNAELLRAKTPFDVLVIGGGPAGAAAAIYAARKGIRTGLAAERFGGQILDTQSIENYISIKSTEGPLLASALKDHVGEYDIDVMNLQRATALLPGDLIEVRFGNGGHLKSKTVILATGARWRDMNVPGEKEYRTKGVTYCPHCDGPLFKGKNVAVIGGGNSGVEAAIDLAGVVKHVTLIEFASELKADAILQRKLRSLHNVLVIVNAQTSEVLGNGQRVTGLTYKNRATGELHSIDVEGIFVQIGLLPNTDWLKGTLDLSPSGEIITDKNGQTSMSGVFAAGDCTIVPYKQIIIAAGEGAKAALGAFDHLIRNFIST